MHHLSGNHGSERLFQVRSFDIMMPISLTDGEASLVSTYSAMIVCRDWNQALSKLHARSVGRSMLGKSLKS